MGISPKSDQYYNDPNVVEQQTQGSGNLTFPMDLVSPEIGRNYYIDLQFHKYERRSIFDQPQLIATSGIQLPIPNNLRDQQGANWQQAQAPDMAVGAGIEQALFEKKSFTGGTLSQRIGSGLNTAAAAGLGIAAGATKNILEKASGTPGTTAQGLQLLGLAQNPFLTMLYQSPTFKSHLFEWTLAPRNEQETETLYEIITQLKSRMLPSIQDKSGGILLNYPDILKVQLYPDDYLYQFKYCAIRDISINFAPSGPSFFNSTDAPTQVILSLALQEIEYWLFEDFDGSINGASRKSKAGGASELISGIGQYISDSIVTPAK